MFGTAVAFIEDPNLVLATELPCSPQVCVPIQQGGGGEPQLETFQHFFMSLSLTSLVHKCLIVTSKK